MYSVLRPRHYTGEYMKTFQESTGSPRAAKPPLSDGRFKQTSFSLGWAMLRLSSLAFSLCMSSSNCSSVYMTILHLSAQKFECHTSDDTSGVQKRS